MISLLSFFALAPLVVSAARIPHQLSDLDASLVSGTKLTHGLDIVPRSRNLINTNPNSNGNPLDFLDNLPIVPDIIHTVTTLLPNIDAGLSFCITLAADADLSSGDGQVLTLDAGICLCVDTDVEINPSPNGVVVELSTGAKIQGALAVKLRRSVSSPISMPGIWLIINVLHGCPHSGPDYFVLHVGADICLQADLFIGFTQHDFSSGHTGVDRCCARSKPMRSTCWCTV
jgi:hypothetical protein